MAENNNNNQSNISDNNDTNPNKIITIDISKSRDASAFDESNIIQVEAREELIRFINESLEKVENHRERLSSRNKNDEHERHHDTIAILGQRGTGKTSFIKSMLKIATSQNSGIDGKLESLGILDPTLLEEKEHIFINIISRIRNKIYDNNSRTATPEVDKICEKLAIALPTIDGMSKSNIDDGWDDPTFVMENGLEKVDACNNLEKNFHKFINESLRILEKDAFIIAFDDIDTNFCKGWTLLETIRKYLTSPQLIVLMSGDLELYSTLVRKNQWNNFGSDLIKNEANKIDEYKTLVDQLEDQYTLKILKPERRINLKSIGEYLRKRYKFIITYKNRTIDIEEISSSLNWAVFGQHDNFYLRSYLLNDSVRRIIQIAYAFVLYGNDITDLFAKKLVDIFSSNLRQFGYNIEKLQNLTEENSLETLIEPLLDKSFNTNNNKNKLKDLYTNGLRPYEVMLPLSIIYNQRIKSYPSLLLRLISIELLSYKSGKYTVELLSQTNFIENPGNIELKGYGYRQNTKKEDKADRIDTIIEEIRRIETELDSENNIKIYNIVESIIENKRDGQIIQPCISMNKIIHIIINYLSILSCNSNLKLWHIINISDNYIKGMSDIEATNLGEALLIKIISLLNNILIEEIQIAGEQPSRETQIRTSITHYIHNVEKAKKDSIKTPIHDLILSSPELRILILLCINKNNDDNKLIDILDENAIMPETIFSPHSLENISYKIWKSSHLSLEENIIKTELLGIFSKVSLKPAQSQKTNHPPKKRQQISKKDLISKIKPYINDETAIKIIHNDPDGKELSNLFKKIGIKETDARKKHIVNEILSMYGYK